MAIVRTTESSVFQKRFLSYVRFSPPDINLAMRRLAAFLFDWCIGMYIVHAIIGLFGIDPGIPQGYQDFYTYQPYSELVSILYYIIGWTNPTRATPGMMIFGIEVQDINGQTLSIRAALIRYFWFSLWLLYLNRISFIASLVYEGGWAEHEEIIRFLKENVFLMVFSKYGLLAILFVLPYVKSGRTVPDYFAKAHVVLRQKADGTA